ncbi:MAG: DUF4271 domain-containing protein [Muribaculaceae bacterium]|nr:DUF4271 domain-containing protein [Muribaculaceae bacterium]
MPVSANHIDSTQHNDTAVGSYSPQYLEGFPTTQAGDSALGQIDTLAVMEIPDGAEAQPFTRSPLHDTPSMALLLAGMLAVALSYHKGYKYIENFFHYMFSTRRRENLFEDHTVNETGILTALIGNTCIVEGFLIFAAVRMLCPSLAPALQANVFPHIAIYCGIAVLFYVGQWLVYKVLGYTFSDKQGTKLWIDGFKATQAFLGLLLLPVLILLMLYPNHGRLLLSIAVSLYLIARLIFIYKGFRIFYGNLSSILYFLLYLCAVEIVPLAILASVTYWISGIY